MLLLLVLSCVSGSVLAALSIPLILQKIGPNPLYGFRVRKTLDDPAVWYPVNAYAAKRLLIVGIAYPLTAIVLFFVPDIDLDVYAISCGAVAVGGILLTVAQSLLYLRAFPGR